MHLKIWIIESKLQGALYQLHANYFLLSTQMMLDPFTSDMLMSIFDTGNLAFDTLIEYFGLNITLLQGKLMDSVKNLPENSFKKTTHHWSVESC